MLEIHGNMSTGSASTALYPFFAKIFRSLERVSGQPLSVSVYIQTAHRII
jgi:hypothetical protein